MNLKLRLLLLVMVLCATSSCIRKKKPHFKHTDIYLAGSTYIESSSPKTISGSSVATYWKNGVPTILTDTVKGSRANGITVVAGSDDYPIYWKNGKRIQLGKNKGQVSAITIVGY